ncbi:group-specific protein [Solibacillus sp. FSL W7-1472]|uniref:group-specific protein n=1 Tax=Solibacillus sp. FSL W7-1472 TaxID=2921707 RepID=UPI0030D91FBD
MFQIDNNYVKEVFRQEVRKKIENISHTTMYWDMKELCRQVSLSETTVKETFFYEEGFPKFRVGIKWLINAKLAEEFLAKWSSQQPNH